MKEISFKNLSVGPYSEDVLKKHWNIASGKGMEFCEIVSLEGENVLQINYPKGEVGKGPLWNYKFEKPVDEYMLEYKVRVPNDFDFVRGGKLPGLYGGSGPAGGASVAEADGFSARIMWRELGVLCQYVYYMDKDPESHWGKNYLWMKGLNKNMPITRDMWKTMNEYFNDRVYIVPGKWHTLKTYIKMVNHRSFNVLGNIAIVNFSDKISLELKKKFAEQLLLKHPTIKTVLEKSGKFSGRLRKMKTKHLTGEKNKEVLYKENNCVFRFNLDTTYFSPRLSNERREIASMIKKNAMTEKTQSQCHPQEKQGEGQICFCGCPGHKDKHRGNRRHNTRNRPEPKCYQADEQSAKSGGDEPGAERIKAENFYGRNSQISVERHFVITERAQENRPGFAVFVLPGTQKRIRVIPLRSFIQIHTGGVVSKCCQS